MLCYSCVNLKYMLIYWVLPVCREVIGDMILHIDRQGDSIPEGGVCPLDHIINKGVTKQVSGLAFEGREI